METEESVKDRFIFYGESTTLILLFVAGLIANIPVLIVYCRSKHIRSITDKFLLNLLIADLVSVTLLFPSILANFLQYSTEDYGIDVLRDDLSPSSNLQRGSAAVTGYLHPHRNQSEEVGSEYFPSNVTYWNWSCGINNGLLAGLATASVLAALEIAMERYLAVVTPLHYHKFLTTPSILITSLVGGLISVASAVITSFDTTHSVFPSCMSHIHKLELMRRFEKGSFNVSNGLNHHLLHHQNQQPDPSTPNNYYEEETSYETEDGNDESLNKNELVWSIYVLIHLTILFIIPVILMTFIYIRIWIEARRQKIRMTQRYKPYFLPVPVGQISSESGDLKPSKLHPILIRFRLMDRLRATRIDRAARVAVFTLFVTILCWSPYYFVRGSDAILKILTLSGSRSSSQDDSLQLGKDGHPSWTNLGSIIPLLFASLHPLLAPIFYAYRYKRLRTEIMKTVCDQISSLCGDHDKVNQLDSKTNRGFSSSSTFGGPPTIRQAIITHPEKTSIIITPVDDDDVDGGHENEPSEIFGQDPATTQGLPEYQPHSHICIDFEPEGGDRDGLECDNDPVCINVSHEADIEGDNLHNVNSMCSDEENCTGGIVHVERKGIINYLSVWMNNYSRRWLQHRESVTSTASFITLLSNKYHNKAHPIASV